MLVELSDMHVNKFVVSHDHFTLCVLTRTNTRQLHLLFANH